MFVSLNSHGDLSFKRSWSFIFAKVIARMSGMRQVIPCIIPQGKRKSLRKFFFACSMIVGIFEIY